jgi:hypothetical protein
MCILVLPSSINLAAKNDQYICAERKEEERMKRGREREKKHELIRSGSISVEYGKKIESVFPHEYSHVFLILS